MRKPAEQSSMGTGTAIPAWCCLLLAAIASTAGCSDAPADGHEVADAAPDGSTGGMDGSVGAWETGENADASGTCTFTLDEYCVPAQGCIDDWTTAQKPEAWCSKWFFQIQWTTCGTHNVVKVQGPDYEHDYYYDGQSTKLIAVVQSVSGTPFACLAGPQGFSPADCDGDAAAFDFAICPDGGTDAG
jgi:hypothetical protein